MARKQIRGIDAFLGEPANVTEKTLSQEASSDQTENQRPAAQTGKGRKKETKASRETRSTMVFQNEHIELLRAISVWDRKPIKLVLEEALTQYFEGKGKKHTQKALAFWRESKNS